MQRIQQILFTDLDGTMVHFQNEITPYATVTSIPGRGPFEPNALYTDNETRIQRECYTLPSSTAGPAYVSARTHDLVQQLRECGVAVAVVTAGRKSTLEARVPMLPAADVYVGETGGRILYNPTGLMYSQPSDGSPSPTCPPPSSLLLDTDWASRFERSTGPLNSDIPPLERPGVLWDLFRRLVNLGLNPDATSYWACFRVDPAKANVTAAEAQELLNQTCGSLPPDLSYASNLGKVDFYPACSGKGRAVEYLIGKMGLTKEAAVAMFDDDNDLPMAAQVGHGLVVRMLTESVKAAVKLNPTWKVASKTGVLATEELLEYLLQTVKENK